MAYEYTPLLTFDEREPLLQANAYMAGMVALSQTASSPKERLVRDALLADEVALGSEVAAEQLLFNSLPLLRKFMFGYNGGGAYQNQSLALEHQHNTLRDAEGLDEDDMWQELLLRIKEHMIPTWDPDRANLSTFLYRDMRYGFKRVLSSNRLIKSSKLDLENAYEQERVYIYRGYETPAGPAHDLVPFGPLRPALEVVPIEMTDDRLEEDILTGGDAPALAPADEIQQRAWYDNTEEAVEKIAALQLLDGLLFRALEPRNQRILRTYFCMNGEDPKTFEEIGQDEDITGGRVGQIVRESLAKLRLALQEELDRYPK